MKILTVVGARPQFIKASAFSRAVAEAKLSQPNVSLTEEIIHTGQHYDYGMSQAFFAELDIPEPVTNLHVSSGLHGAMTGAMLGGIEQEILARQPDWVLVYGDTNSTLAGALAAVKLKVAVAHVESGLRSFNRAMPEEHNRVLTDHCADLLFCPTKAAVANLAAEGLADKAVPVGDIMYDVSLYYRDRSAVLALGKWGVSTGAYVLVTVHRAENTDDPLRLVGIFKALAEIATQVTVVLPLHPRTAKCLELYGLTALLDGLRVVPPVSYLEMVRLETGARAILTDSGGVQKEAFFYRVPCLTLRDESEWVETLELGANRLCGADTGRILENWQAMGAEPLGEVLDNPYGDGRSANKILDFLLGAVRK